MNLEIPILGANNGTAHLNFSDKNSTNSDILKAEFYLPTDHARTDQQLFTGSMISTNLKDPVKSQLANLARDIGSDLATAVLVAWSIVLSRLSGQDTILLGYGSTATTGALTTALTLRLDLSGEPDTSNLLERVKHPLSAACDHEDTVSQARFYSHTVGYSRLFNDSIPMQSYLELHLVQDKEIVSMSIRYATDLYNKDTIDRYAGYLQTTLTSMAANTNQPVASFDIVSAVERKLLLETWNDTDAAYPSDRCVHHLYEDQVVKTPAAIAVAHHEKELTYSELNSLANNFARQLTKTGIGRGDFAVLFFERSIELVAAELAVLKIGAVCVPVDIRTPADRLAFILSDTRSNVLVTNDEILIPSKISSLILRFNIDQCKLDYDPGANASHSYHSASSVDAAFVLFTSGTTGVPKGVIVPHAAVTRAVLNNGFTDIDPMDCVAFVSSPSFVPSTFDVFLPLLNGARVVIIDDDTKMDAHRLAEALVRHQVTCLYIATPLLVQYGPIIGKTLSNLRYLLSGGEQGQVKAYAAVLKHGGPVRLINRFGSTETSSAIVYTITDNTMQLDRLPIGRPSSNRRVYLLDKYRNLVPIGALGEMYVGGPGVATEYLNRPDITAERFLSDPFYGEEGARMYKSGDLARYMPDGNLVCYGRNDDLVKIRAYRVELGEIQARLIEHHLVRNAVAVAIGEDDNKKLVAYIEADSHSQLGDALRDFLAPMLPDYMIPAAFVIMDKLPLANGGKVDRRALPAPTFSSFVNRDHVDPQGDIETSLAAMWSQLLKLPRISRYDNFFKLGGHSIMAMRLMNTVAATLGPQLPISALFTAPTLQDLAEAITINAGLGTSSNIIIRHVSRNDLQELSYAQQRLWFLVKARGASDNYHITRALRLRGALDHVALQKALDTLYARHMALRSAFPTVDGEAKVQILPSNIQMTFELLDLQSNKDRESSASQSSIQEVRAPFDIERGGLIRAKLIQLGDQDHIFLLTLHHIVADGWSMGVIFRELNVLYNAYSTGHLHSLIPLTIQYPDYAAWQRQQLTEDKLQLQTTYWRKTLSGAPVSIELPTDRPRPPQQSFVGASVPVRLDRDLTNGLKSLSRKHGVTMFMTVLAAWSAVLSRLSGQEDIVIGTPSANRGHPQAEQLIGFFVSTLALRIDLSDEPNTKRLLERVSQATISAHAHQDLPFEQVVDIVQPVRRADVSPIFQVMLAWQNNDVDTLDLKDVKTFVEHMEHSVLQFDLDLELFERDGEIVGGLNYSTSIFDRETIEHHVGYLEAMLRWMVLDEEKSVGTAPILGPSERELLLETWNAMETPYPDNSCIHRLFESQVEMSPDAIAIVHDAQLLTYRELNSRANWIARQLISAGVMPGDYVMLLFDRSIDLVASQIAVLKVGAAYVPIDTNAPLDRHAYIASDCRSTVIVTDQNRDVPPMTDGVILRLASMLNGSEDMQDTFDSSAGSSSDTAYVMYTSGSTGRPKGVMVSHRGIARLVLNNGYTEITPNDRIGFMINPSFDPSTFEIWSALLHGSRLVIIDKNTVLDAYLLEALILRHKVTILVMPSAVFHHHICTISRTLANLKYLIAAGEQAQLKAYVTMARHGGPCKIINAYGPTETTVLATVFTDEVAVDRSERIPIGRPAGNTRVYVLDRHMEPVPLGVAGELYIGGPGVANGYLNRPELTAEKFLRDPFSQVQDARMYKTGDLVRYLPDGNLVFLSRNDNQVKIRGFRVELGEIESRLTEHPLVREAVVLVLDMDSDNKRLVAYVVAEHEINLVDTLRQYVSAILPEYMVPSAIVRLDAFPLTNNGKIDRGALPEPTSESLPACKYEPPQGQLEIALAAIWSDLLKIERVGRRDNFFMLGGHSLMAVRLMNKVSSLGVGLSLSTLFAHPTLAALVNAVNPADQHDSSHSAITPEPRGGPLELSLEQQRLWFLAQMDRLSEVYHVPFATRLLGTLDRAALEKSMRRLFSRHESLRSVFVVVDGAPQVRLLSVDDDWHPLAVHDLRGQHDRELNAIERLSHGARAPFDLTKGPVVRSQLIQLSDTENILQITMHHIVTDGWSMDVMVRELNVLYNAYSTEQPDPLAPLTIQYPDYAAWQRQQFTQDKLQLQTNYWRENLAGVPVSIELPTDRPRPLQQSFVGASVPVRLDRDLTNGLKSLSRKHGVTMFMTVLAAWSAVLSRLSGQEDIVIGTPSANRGHPQVEQLIGLFVSTLALRIDLSHEPTLKQLLERVRMTTIAAQAHQDFSFEQVVGIVCPPRRTDITPIFQVMMAWQNDNVDELKLRDIEAVYEHQQYDVAKFDLDLFLGEIDGEIVGGLNYSTAIFDRETVERHVGYLEAMLRWIVTDAEESVTMVPILGPTERELLLETWNATEAPYPDNYCIHRLFESQVEMSPDAVAIVHAEQSLTYRQLNARANWIAQKLVETGVKASDYAMLLFDRSIDLVASQIAVLKVGATYVPIDTNAPLERQVYIASDCGSTVIITDQERDVPPMIDGVVLRVASTVNGSEDMQDTFDSSAGSSSDTAYVMYTSGSTGRPKGVMISHRGIARLVLNNGYTEITPNDRIGFMINPSFDPSTFEIWSALLHGSRLVIIDKSTVLDAHLLEALILRHKVTILVMPSAVFHHHVCTISRTLANLKYLIAAGEQAQLEAYVTMSSHGGPCKIINAYGPTETTVLATVFTDEVAVDRTERIPIGRPAGNTRVYVLDRHMEPVPIGVAGELYIGGPGVANGYLNRPELTAEKFLRDPFSQVQDARMYKTGDLVRYLPDGNLVFLSRNDNQVKIRGFRVELGEIESRLTEHPLVREAVVLVLERDCDDKRLVAYVVAEYQKDLVKTLRQYLSVVLPEYMVPSTIVLLDVFPLTNNGKIDRGALPEPTSESLSTLEYEAPEGQSEIALATIWSDLLRVERVGRHANFFMLGGHSLMAVRMMEQLRQQGYVLPVWRLFENPTLQALASCLNQREIEVNVPENLLSPTTIEITPDLLPLINLTQDDIDRIVNQVPGGVPNIQDIYGLSPLQDGILFHHMMQPVGDTYMLAISMSFRDRELLDRYLGAFQKVVDRHNALRTAFIWKNLSTPAQVVLRRASLSAVEHKLDTANGPIADQLLQMYNPETYRLELHEPPLVHFAYSQEIDGTWVAVQLLHHLIGDHSTLEILNEELEKIMDGDISSLPTPQPYRNLIAQMRLGFSVEEHERFFERMLHDIDYPSLPYGLSDVYGDGVTVKEFHCMLSQDLNIKLRDQAKRLGVSLASLCHLAWARVVAATSGASKVVFGTVLFGRMQGGAGSDSTMGLYINTLPIRIDVEGANVLDSVRRVHADLAGLLEHEHASMVHANRCSGVPPGTTLFSSILNYRHNSAPEVNPQGILGVEILSEQERTNYPVILSVEDYGSSLGLTAQIVDPYESSKICKYMQQALVRLAAALEQSPDMPVQCLNVLPAEEYNMVVHTWNNTDVPYPDDKCVHELFENQVENSPEAIAIVHDEQSLTYRELNYRANWIAQKLVETGVMPGNYVMLLFDRSIGHVASQIAVLKVGAAYVPIDPSAPPERQAYIASDCGSAVIITDQERDVPPMIDGVVLRVASTVNGSEDMQDTFESSAGSSSDTAYVMYTSGSTGRPKGVMVSHRGIARLVLNNGYTEITPNDRIGFMINPSFDPSTFEIWSALLHGSRLVIIDKSTVLDAHLLEALILRHKVTILVMPSAVFHHHICTISRTLANLKYLIAAGEQAQLKAYVTMARHGGPCKIINAYGPTETTVLATVFTDEVAVDRSERIPIGRPAGNTRVYVLDRHMEPVPLGVVGELYIGGPGVANGYLNRPDLTAEKFLRDPFSQVQDARMYKTGDLVRYLPDGNLVFLGRNDNQVKIRGFRVELGEIESRLTEHPLVREAVVLVLDTDSDNKRLVAYVVAEHEINLVDTLRQYVSAILPEYMVPSAIVRLDAFPLTNNGKIDRGALPEPTSESLLTLEYEAPQGQLELTLAAIWSNLLKIERVGRHDNFFMLGGHSLMAVRMMEQLRQQGYVLPVWLLFESPTLQALASCLNQGQAEVKAPENLISSTTVEITPDLLPLIDLTQNDIDLIVDQVPGGVPNIQDIYGLSPLQDGILFHHMMQPVGDTYLLVICKSFRDKELLHNYLGAFQKVVDRHNALRTAFIWKNLSTPAQVVLRRASLSAVEHKLDTANGPIADQLLQMYNPETYRLELHEPPLVHFAYSQEIDGTWVAVQLLHHLIGDHSTLEILNEELEKIMDGDISSLPTPQPYRNLIAQMRLGFSVEEHERFFERMLHDIDYPSLPYGLSDVYGDGVTVKEFHCMLSQDLNIKLRDQAKRLGVSLASLCHLAWARVVAATSGASKVVFGTVLFGRMQGGAGSDSTMGLYINALPIRIDVEGANVLDSARRVHADLAGLLEHEHASMVHANRCSGVPPRTPLFSSILNYRHNSASTDRPPTIARVEILSGRERTSYPFGLSVEDYGISLGLTAQIVDPYEPSKICGYMQHALVSLADAIEQSPDMPVQSLNVLPTEEYEMVIGTWNSTDTSYPDDKCVHLLFENQVEKSPEAIAIVHDEQSLTYRELNSRANWIAQKLVETGVKASHYVMLLFDRSIDLVASQIAVLKVGAAYVPIDPSAPPERQAYIASDCGSTVLITDEYRELPVELCGNTIRVSSEKTTADKMIDNLTCLSVSSGDTAYVMYTSGSTGRPKGVMVSHRSIAGLVLNNGYTEITPDDSVGFTNNPSFDPSTLEVWSAILRGSRLVIIDKNTLLDAHLLEAWIMRHQVTMLFTTNAILHSHVFAIGGTLSNLKYLIAGGEQAQLDAYVTMARRGGQCKVINVYGPTETTVIATAYTEKIAVDRTERIPIGRAAGNTRLYVLDRHMELVPLGVVGELYIGGPGVANGYLNRPDLTAEKFLRDPFIQVQDARMYKTGDLVRYLPDGNLVFLGRGDNQVKIRGFRVELGEIESCLAEHPLVREAVVLFLDTDSDNKHLVAYVVAEHEINIVGTLRQYVSVILPEYMVPSSFVCMDAFPLTDNGKIDRRAFPEPTSESRPTSEYVAPQGELEVTLAAIWSDLLKIERVGRHDNFFMLGGHSLMAVRLINIIRTTLGVDLKLHVLFASPRLCDFTHRLRADSSNDVKDSYDEYGVLIPLKPQGIRHPLFCIHPGPGLAWSYRGLVTHLHPEQPLYGLQARGLDGQSPLASSMDEMCVDYINHIRKVQPQGPYYLLGWSFGGKVAHGIATMLQSQGEIVSLLVIMDSRPFDSAPEKAPLLAIKEVSEEKSASEGQEDGGGQEEELNKYDDYLSRLIGDRLSEESFATKRKVAPVFDNNRKLAKLFEPTIFSGDILFIRSIACREEAERLIDPVVWEPYVSGSIEVRDIACAHEEMDKAEHLAVTGRVVAEYIEKLSVA